MSEDGDKIPEAVQQATQCSQEAQGTGEDATETSTAAQYREVQCECVWEGGG